MTHLRLGEILLRQGLITEKQLNNAIEAQKTRKGRIGEILIDQGVISEESIASALGTQLGIPYYSSENPELLRPKEDQKLEELIAFEFAKKNFVLPLSRHANSLTCAITDPLDVNLLDNLRRITKCDINIVLATSGAIRKAINDFYSSKASQDKKSILEPVEPQFQASYNPDRFKDNFQKGTTLKQSELSLDKLIEKAGEAPVIKLVDLIIRQAVDERASDIHIEPFEDKIHLRYRIDGKLYDIPPPAPHLHMPIVSRLKILARLDIAEKRLPQNGVITVKLEDRVIEILLSTIPTVWGEKIAMRVLDKISIPLDLTNLGFAQKQIDTLRKLINTPQGLFIVSGPTGSGKSTTIYTMLNELINPTKNIMTVEDPVEYKIEGINQVSIRPDIGLNYSTVIKSFLRQDPDIIMVSDIPDLETANVCVRTALNGNLVLASMAANDTASLITQFIDFGTPQYLLGPCLIGVLNQRLARRLCQRCKEPYEPDLEHKNITTFRSDLIYRAKGCDECKGTGYRGMIIVPEILVIDNDIRALITKSSNTTEIKDTARKKGMSTIFESGVKLVEEGLTSFDEICSICIDSI